MATLDHIAAGEEIVLKAPGGRKIHLYLHSCDVCTSLDVWTDAGNPVEEISANTLDTTRAPIGVFAIQQGRRHILEAGHSPERRTVDYPAVGTVHLLWREE